MKHRNKLILHYSTDVRTLHSIDLDSGMSIEVFGDPDNGCYEWRLVNEAGLVDRHSDVGYGIPAIALRDGLIEWYGDLGMPGKKEPG